MKTAHDLVSQAKTDIREIALQEAEAAIQHEVFVLMTQLVRK